MGRRGLPGHVRNRAERLQRAFAQRGRAAVASADRAPAGRRSQPQRGPLPGRRRHRQQLHAISRCRLRRILSAASAAGANNIKVASVADFAAGQTIIIDSGANRETAVIATVGTAGGTTVGTATDAGATVIPVASAAGFSAGQTITIDSGANLETAVVASVTGGGRGRGGFGGGRGGPGGAYNHRHRAAHDGARAKARRSPARGITLTGCIDQGA